MSAPGMAPLDAAINTIANHRQYHANLVPELTALLASFHNSASKDSHRQPCEVKPALLRQQIKRLYNQSIVTLSKWSELLNAPDASDVVARETNSATATANHSSAASTAPLAPKPGAAAAATFASEPRVMRSILRTGALVRNRAVVVGDVPTQKRVGLMRGANAKSDSTLFLASGPKSEQHSQRATKSKGRTSRTGPVVTAPQEPSRSRRELGTPSQPASGSSAPPTSVYDTERPTYAHVDVLVDVGFLGVRTLELLCTDTSTHLLEAEKARSHLIVEIIHLGMKKRALQELGSLRERLIQSAMTMWADQDLEMKHGQLQTRAKATTEMKPTSSSSVESIKSTYQDLFSFPLPKALLTLDLDSMTSTRLDQVQTFVRLVQALHNNALRCWTDVRSGSLAYLLPEMMSRPGSPYDWCTCMAKLDRTAGLRSLDALYRLLFSAALKRVQNDPSFEGQRHAFILRIHGIRYHGAYRHLAGVKDGLIWSMILKCGVEFVKSTKGQPCQDDITALLTSYRTLFEFLDDLLAIDSAEARFQEWRRHFEFFAHQTDNASLRAFVETLQSERQDPEIAPVNASAAGQQPVSLSHFTSPIIAEETKRAASCVSRSAAAPAKLGHVSSEEPVLTRLDEAVKALRSFEKSLQVWYSVSPQGAGPESDTASARDTLLLLRQELCSLPREGLTMVTLQNVARIFRSMDTIRSIGSKIMDKCEKEQLAGDAATVFKTSHTALRWLGCVQIVLQILSDVTAGLWQQVHLDYTAAQGTNRKYTPDPTKLSCARVDAILFLFRLQQSSFDTGTVIGPDLILKFLESAFSVAQDMNDLESLPWISNALYNLGGALFKADRRRDAIRPLEAAVECYLRWLHDDLGADIAMRDVDKLKDESVGVKSSRAEERIVLANRYEVLGVCLQAVNDLDRALACFDSGICALPLEAFLAIDTVALGELKTSQLPAAKLLNRRARVMLMKDEPRFTSIVTAVPKFESELNRRSAPIHVRGIVQEFECRLLSVLSMKPSHAGGRGREQVDILKHVLAKIYRKGRWLTHPIRRARALIQLAVLYQGNAEVDLRQEAFHLVEEAIEILKEKDLKADADLEPARNHYLAMAYSWSGILDRHRGEGFSRKSKPFQIALQLWELVLSSVDCFVSCENLQLVSHRSTVERVQRRLPEPEMLYDHLQMLADCLGMIDYRVLQVQVYLLMLRLCNGILPVTDDTRSDAARIYARMAQAYLALGYSGKAMMALNHGKLILEEMEGFSKGSTASSHVYATWLLVYSLYLTSVGHTTQGVSAYNLAKHHSDQHQSSIDSREYASDSAPKIGRLPRKVETRVFRAIIMIEASLARSELLFSQGDLSEAISDAKHAARQLSQIVSTLSAAVKAAQADPDVVKCEPMENPFLVSSQPMAIREGEREEGQHTREQHSIENRQLRQGLELLATQRCQWSICRLLIEAYHQLGTMYLNQGSWREAEYFFREGKHIAQLSKAGKSVSRFMLDHAVLMLRRHEWQETRQALQSLDVKGSESNASELAWEIQDARIQLLSGDLHFVTEELEQSLQAYYRTDEVLSHLMDKSFISDLEQLVIREPQTPREAKLMTLGRSSSMVGPGMRLRADAPYGPGMPDASQFECIALGGIKAAIGYRTGLIFGLQGRRTQAHSMIEGSREEDPMAFTIAEYHLTKAKVLILELEHAMAKHLMYAMIPESALSVGLFKKTRTLKLASPPPSFSPCVDPEDSSIPAMMKITRGSLLSSPSLRVTRMTRRRRSQLVIETPLHSPSRSRTLRGAQPKHDKSFLSQYREILKQAREQLSAAYQCSIQVDPPHVIADICSRQAYLSVLESCFHQEPSQENPVNGNVDGSDRCYRADSQRAMAIRAACYLELSKAITQHREMHGLIKQKLYPDLQQESQAWPRNIQPKDQVSQPFWTKREPYHEAEVAKMANSSGIEKPRRLQLTVDARDLQRLEDQVLLEIEKEEAVDLNKVGMKPADLRTRRGKREFFNRQSRLRPSMSLGNERSFLEVLDKVYERDLLMLDDRPESFQEDFVDILPDNWTVVTLSMDLDREVLYVNRLRANAMPLVVRLPLNRAQLREGDDQDLGLQPELGFDEEEGEPTPGPPLSYKGAAEELQDILRGSQETLALSSSKHHGVAAGVTSIDQRPAELTREVKAEWWSRRQRLDDRLCALLGSMEDQWLCGLKGLIQSHNTPANDENLLDFKQTLEWIMSQAAYSMSSASSGLEPRTAGRRTSASQRTSLVQLEINIDLCRVILHLGDQPSFTELKDLIYFLLDAYLYKNVTPSASNLSGSTSGVPMVSSASSSPIIEYSEVQFSRIAMQIKEALRVYWHAETDGNNNGFDAGAHVILVLDKHLQKFPWESCPVLREEAVSRVPSMCFLRDRILQQRHRMDKDGQQDLLNEQEQVLTRLKATPIGDSHDSSKGNWQDLEVDPQRTFYLLNPGGDLKNTENEFKEYVESQHGWDGIIGRAPLDLECIEGLSKNDLYVYFGHSGGEQFIKSTQVRQLGHCAVSLLLGCSSGSLKGDGELDPTGNVIDYLLAGCPTVVANLWDVTDKDLDRFSMAMFTLWGLEANRRTGQPSEEKDSGNGLKGDEITQAEAMEGVERSGLRLSLVEAVKEAREECKLKYLVGAASVVYGIPCFLKERSV